MPSDKGWEAINAIAQGILFVALILGLALICNCSRPSPVPVAAVADSARFADTTAQFYQIGDSVFVRATFVPHGRGVIIEIQPVKIRKTKGAAK